MKLTPSEAEKLKEIYRLVNNAFNLLEDLRPGGGFVEYTGISRYERKYACMSCGNYSPETMSCGLQHPLVCEK